MNFARLFHGVLTKLQNLDGLSPRLMTLAAVLLITIGVPMLATSPSRTLGTIAASVSRFMPEYSEGGPQSVAPNVQSGATPTPTPAVDSAHQTTPAPSGVQTTQVLAASPSVITVSAGALSSHFTLTTNAPLQLCSLQGVDNISHLFAKTADNMEVCEAQISAYIATDTATKPGTFHLPVSVTTSSGVALSTTLTINVVSEPSFWLTASTLSIDTASSLVTGTVTLSTDSGYVGTPEVSTSLDPAEQSVCINPTLTPDATIPQQYDFSCTLTHAAGFHDLNVTFTGQDGRVMHTAQSTASF